MTIHVNRKTLKIFKERYKTGIHKKLVCIRYTKTKTKTKCFGIWNSICILVYGSYTKVIKKIKTKNYGIQSAIWKFWYMSGIQAKKSHLKSYTNLFCRVIVFWRWNSRETECGVSIWSKRNITIYNSIG